METPPDPQEEPPVYALRLTASANAALLDAFAFQIDAAGEARAVEWQGALLRTIAGLATFPTRKPAAPEASRFAPPPVRAALFQAAPGAALWRILFRVIAHSPDGPTVQIVTVRHSASRPLTRQEAQAIDATNR